MSARFEITVTPGEPPMPHQDGRWWRYVVTLRGTCQSVTGYAPGSRSDAWRAARVTGDRLLRISRNDLTLIPFRISAVEEAREEVRNAFA